MNRAAIIVFIYASAMLLISCSRPNSRFSSFTDSDWRTLQKKAEMLCAACMEPSQQKEDEDTLALRGSDIPAVLRYLHPERVWVRANSITVEFWRTPAGDDTIDVYRDKDGIWTITVHEGSWRNEPRDVWTSKEG